MLYEQYDSSGHKKLEPETNPCEFFWIALLVEIFKWRLCNLNGNLESQLEIYNRGNSLKWDRN